MFVTPGETGVTIPVLLTVSMLSFSENHVYVNGTVPVAFDVNDSEPPMHTAFPPVIGFATGSAFTLTTYIADVV